MRVGLIGGTGFVGSDLVDRLVELGHVPSVLLRAGSEDKLRHTRECRVTTGDVSSQVARSQRPSASNRMRCPD